jgi:hypothetical protein
MKAEIEFEARNGLNAVRRPDPLKQFLRYLSEDAEFAYKFLDQERISTTYDDDNIIRNITGAWDDEICDLSERFIAAFQPSPISDKITQSKFARQLATIIDQFRPGYLERLTTALLPSGVSRVNVSNLLRLLAFLLKPDNVGTFVAALSTAGVGDWAVYQTLLRRRAVGDVEGQIIYNKGRDLLPVMFSKAEEVIQAREHEPTPEERDYSRFQKLLITENGEYWDSVFGYFADHADRIDALVTLQERERLSSLITDSILAQLDPNNYGLTLTVNPNGTTVITADRNIHLVGDSIRAASRLNMDLSQFKDRVISYIPFASSEHLTAIFRVLPNVQPSDFDRLISVYVRRDSDLWRWNLDSFFEVVEGQRLTATQPVLRSFIDSDQLTGWDRTKALELSQTLSADKTFLLQQFERYRNAHRMIAEKANELLIAKFCDADAVRWRIDQIRDRFAPFVEPIGRHTVGDLEGELHDMSFAKPLCELKDQALLPEFLSLLGFSFELIGKDESYHRYSQYIWKIVRDYFDNLKETRSFNPLMQLERFVAKYARREGVNWFSAIVAEVKQSYSAYIGRPETISLGIKKYNDLKSRSFLPISTERDLIDFVRKQVAKELSDWLQGDGRKLAEDCLSNSRTAEKKLQKLVAIKLPAIMMEKGFRPNEIITVKEPESLDDTKPDFLIYYGLSRPVVVEFKLASHTDCKATNLKMKESFRSFGNYLRNHNACGGIFVVIDNVARDPGSATWSTQLDEISEAYQTYQNSFVVGIGGLGSGLTSPVRRIKP